MKRWEILGLALVLLVLVGTPAAVFAGQRYLNSSPHEYTIVAHTDEDGGWVPREITVTQGEHVRLRLTSADVSHGLLVPGLNINVPEIYPGKYMTVDFTTDKPGRYPFICTVLCSSRHSHMQGAIVVLPSAAPAATTPVAPPTGTDSAVSKPLPDIAQAVPSAASTSASAGTVAGKTVYEANCMACHGPDAAGGLDLGNVKSADLRWSKLGKTYQGDLDLIRRAVLAGKNEQGRDLNAVMPRWQGKLSDAQVNAIIAYLEQGAGPGH